MKPSNLKLFLSAFLLVSVVLFPLHRFPVWAADPLAILYDSTLDVAVKGVVNAPHNYDEALVGTPLPILPAAGGDMIDAGTATAVRGLDNLIGPFLGRAPDAGAYEQGLGLPWTGPRRFANLLAYGLPTCWRVAAITELSDYTSLGAPESVEPNAFRLLLVTDSPGKPRAFILATFQDLPGEARWSRFEELLRPSAGDTVLISPIEFRDGLGASIIARGNNAHLLGARVDDEGVLKVFAGVAKGSLRAVQEDWFTFVRSFWYAWYLQDPQDSTISMEFVTPPAPGVVPVGAAAAPSTGNAVVPGTLRGDVTITNASIIWDVEGDANLNATATVQFRRQGTTEWRDALDLSRINHTSDGIDIRNRVTGSIFRFAPGTTYEVQVTLSDSDGGGETRTTTFTTRQVPKPGDGRLVEVRPTDDLDAVTAAAQPGDTFLFHAGTYTGSQDRLGWMILNSGTRERPILFRAFGDGVVNFRSIGIINIWVQGSHVWLDGFQIVNPISTEPGNRGIVMYSPSNSPRLTGVSVTRNTIRDGWMLIHPQHTNDSLISDNSLIGAGQDPNAPPWDPSDPSTHPSGHMLSSEGIEFEKGWTRGHVVAFNEITAVGDGVSYGGGNIDVHGNRIHETYDDSIEPDYSWDNYRVYGNLAWMSVETNFSFQPIEGGPWYIVQNQFTGTRHNPFKMEGGAAQYVVANTIVSSHWTQAANGLFRRGSVFSNNYWKALSLQGGYYNSLGRGPEPDPSVMLLWGYNRYDAHPDNVWGWWGSLENAQARGAELNTRLVTDRGTEGLQIYEGTSVTLSSNTGAASFTWSWNFSINGGPEQPHSSGTGSIPSATFDSKGLANRRVEWILRASDSAGAQEARLSIDVWPGSCGQGLSPSPTLCGDANKDGQVTLSDVVLVIQSILGIKPDPGCQADVVNPAGLTLADALKILDYILGKVANLTCCGG